MPERENQAVERKKKKKMMMMMMMMMAMQWEQSSYQDQCSNGAQRPVRRRHDWIKAHQQYLRQRTRVARVRWKKMGEWRTPRRDYQSWRSDCGDYGPQNRRQSDPDLESNPRCVTPSGTESCYSFPISPPAKRCDHTRLICQVVKMKGQVVQVALQSPCNPPPPTPTPRFRGAEETRFPHQKRDKNYSSNSIPMM